MFAALDHDTRMLLLKLVCAFAWTDLELHEGERAFVERLVSRLELDEADRRQVEEWLTVAPSPGSVDAAAIPREHRRTFIEAARAIIYADGEVDDEEREQLDRLREALAG